MSRYSYTTDQHTIVVGYDPPLSTLFAQVWEKDRVGDTPLVWLGADEKLVTTLSALVEPLASYGGVPLVLQATLLRELDDDRPLSFAALCKAAVAICSQSPVSRLPAGQLPVAASYYIVLDEGGWHLFGWGFANAMEAEAAYSRSVYAGQSTQRVSRTEAVASYLSDPQIYLRVDEHGFTNGLPIFAGVRLANRGAGAFLSGPVVCAGEYGGLTAEQVVQVVEREVFAVESELRQSITELWYRGWKTLRTRPSEEQAG
jgi:hypothetical protein